MQLRFLVGVLVGVLIGALAALVPYSIEARAQLSDAKLEAQMCEAVLERLTLQPQEP